MSDQLCLCALLTKYESLQYIFRAACINYYLGEVSDVYSNHHAVRFYEQDSTFIIDLHKSRWSTALPALLGNRLLLNMRERAKPLPVTTLAGELTTMDWTTGEIRHGTFVG